MRRLADILASFPRRALLHGGRYDGADLPVLLPADRPWPPTVCRGLIGASWHYVHEATMPGVYVYAGSCAEFGCTLPHDHDAPNRVV